MTSPRLPRRAVLAGLVVLGLGGCAVGSPEPLAQARVAWRFQAVGDVLGLATAEGLVLAGTARGAVHAVDVATGSHVWAESLLLRAARPTVIGALLAASDTTDTHGLQVTTGRRVWQVPGTLVAAGEAAVVVRSRWSESPAAGMLTAHDPATGEARWTLPWTGPPPTASLSGDAVHLGGADRIVTVAAGTGAPLWQRPTTAGPPPVAGRESVFLVDGGALTCLDARTGVVSWQAAGAVSGLLSVVGTLVCAAGGDRIAAWDAAGGEAVWTWSGDGDPRDLGPAVPVDGPVVLTSGVTVPAAADGRRVVVLALDARSGDLRWRADLPDPAPSGARAAPVATATGLVVAAAGSWICAVTTAPGP
ncbi:MAG: PQQ-binding-like beta-propeller repeat protein [Pseudonocardia sp.]